MDSSDQPTLRALAVLYLTFGHATDGTMTGDEMRTLGKRLHRWIPDMGLPELGEILRDTVAEYRDHRDRADKLEYAVTVAHDLCKRATPDELANILADLRQIAEADGSVAPAEQAFIERLGSIFAAQD